MTRPREPGTVQNRTKIIINLFFTCLHGAFMTWPQRPDTIQSRRKAKLKLKKDA